MTPEAFEADIQKGFFAEWANVHGYYYGTSKAFIDEVFREGKSVLLDIDVQGAESLWRAYGAKTYRIFISPPSIEVLEQRLRERGTDSEAVIARRIENARNEMAQRDRFELQLINDDLQKTYRALEKSVLDQLGVRRG